MSTGTVSKLPAAQIARRAELEAAELANKTNTPPTADLPVEDQTPTGEVPVVPTSVVDTPAPIVDTNDNSGTVTLSREEINDLRARAERADTDRGRRETLELELAEAQAALTRAGEAPKGTGNEAAPVAPAAPEAALVIDPGDTSLTEEETKEYGEAEPIIAKLARKEIAALVNPLVERINKLEQSLTKVSQGTAKAQHEGFVNQVKQKITNFDAVVKHKHWDDFLDSRIPGAGMTQRQALANAHFGKNLEDMEVIFDTFSKKYLGQTNKADFAGITPSGGNGDTPPITPKAEMLKMSVRREASDNYLKGRITSEELAAIKKQFSEADAKGLVDYNN